MSIFGNYSLVIWINTILFLFLICIVLNFLAMFVARKTNIVDNPGNDKLKIHKRPTPLSGGIALFIFVLFIILSQLFFVFSPTTLILLFSAIVIFIFGVLDDKFRIGPNLRLIVHSSVAVLVFWLLQSISILNIFLALMFAVFFVGGIVSVNMIDGMDGICTTMAAISFAGYFILFSTIDSPYKFLPFLLFIFSLAFLFFNFHPAKAFLGSSGSELLGFIFVFLSLIISNANIWQFVFAVLIIGVPLIDMARVMIIRKINKKPMMSGDRNHIFDWIRSRGFTQKKIWLLLSFSQIIIVFVLLIISKSIY